ncbi:MAG: hypothetical protein M5U34_31010 [Chloroflexi bacterium]|nr:hypothetical protein [Chloroflexota bacterium]
MLVLCRQLWRGDHRHGDDPLSAAGGRLFSRCRFPWIIALEVFVGEKERKSLEPLLATPLTDAQLYLGKMVAVLDFTAAFRLPGYDGVYGGVVFHGRLRPLGAAFAQALF